MLRNFMSLLPSADFFFEKNCFKNISFRRTSRVSNRIQIMPDIFSLIWVQAVANFSRQIFDVVGSKYGVFFAFKKNSTTSNLRIGVFPQFVIFKTIHSI